MSEPRYVFNTITLVPPQWSKMGSQWWILPQRCSPQIPALQPQPFLTQHGIHAAGLQVCLALQWRHLAFQTRVSDRLLSATHFETSDTSLVRNTKTHFNLQNASELAKYLRTLKSSLTSETRGEILSATSCTKVSWSVAHCISDPHIEVWAR